MPALMLLWLVVCEFPSVFLRLWLCVWCLNRRQPYCTNVHAHTGVHYQLCDGQHPEEVSNCWWWSMWQNLSLDCVLQGPVPWSVCSHCVWELRGWHWDRWQASRTSTMGHSRYVQYTLCVYSCISEHVMLCILFPIWTYQVFALGVYTLTWT